MNIWMIVALWIIDGIVAQLVMETAMKYWYSKNNYNPNELEKVRFSVYSNWAEEQISKGFVWSIVVLWLGPIIFWPFHICATIPRLESEVVNAMN